MDKIKIAITGRVASVVALPEVVADNAEYEVDFALDPREGWDMSLPITVLFVRRDGFYTPRIMDAGKTSCTMPPQTGTNIVFVGLTQDDMRTTTPAAIKVHRSIRTVAHDPLPAPSEDVYAQILAAYAGIKILSGKGAPTSATQGKINQLYRDEDTQKLYICTATDGGYTWAAVSGGSVDVDATLTKAGYAADAKAAGDAIGRKIDKAQGVENAGMILGVGEDGNVVPGDPSYLPGFVSYTRAQELTYEQQVRAKENIGAGTLRRVYYWRANGTPENPNGVMTCAIYGDTCICGGGDSLPDGMKAPVLVIYGSIDRGYRDATAFDGSNATWTFTVNLRDYSYSTPIKKSGIPTPTTAQVGQIVKVKAVDADGKITETEAVDMPSGGTYTLPIASPTVLGGVKPIAKTDEMTQGVGVDATGALWTAAGGSGGSGGENWRLINTVTTTEDTSIINITQDSDGNSFSLKKAKVFSTVRGNSASLSNWCRVTVNGLMNYLTSELQNTFAATDGQDYYNHSRVDFAIYSGRLTVDLRMASLNNAASKDTLYYIQNTGYWDSYNDAVESITSIRIWSSTAGIGAGTEIVIYGVDA